MAVSNLVIGTVMGLVLLVIAGAIGVVRNWERQSPGMSEAGSALENAVNSPTAWTVVFLVFALGLGIGGVVFVGGLSIPGVSQGVAQAVLIGGFGLLVAFFFLAGIYSTVRARGLGSAPAVGISSAILGLLIIAGIVLNLLLA